MTGIYASWLAHNTSLYNKEVTDVTWLKNTFRSLVRSAILRIFHSPILKTPEDTTPSVGDIEDAWTTPDHKQWVRLDQWLTDDWIGTYDLNTKKLVFSPWICHNGTPPNPS
mmetsp:Transcript_43809/g.71224  ORF Transcript_43809/g.71224 Transcript_43809/m.71224 type:complete len:111 (-) Transcript_43809:103-435(-)